MFLMMGEGLMVKNRCQDRMDLVMDGDQGKWSVGESGVMRLSDEKQKG